MLNITTASGTRALEAHLVADFLRDLRAPIDATDVQFGPIMGTLAGMGDELDYEHTVLMLGALGFGQHARGMIERFGATTARLMVRAHTLPALEQPAIFWPGDVELVGDFSLSALHVGGSLTVEGSVDAQEQSVGGVIRIIPRAALLARTFDPIVFDLRCLPSLGRA